MVGEGEIAIGETVEDDFLVVNVEEALFSVVLAFVRCSQRLAAPFVESFQPVLVARSELVLLLLKIVPKALQLSLLLLGNGGRLVGGLEFGIVSLIFNGFHFWFLYRKRLFLIFFAS